jgi:hypothetical protein
LTVALLTLTVVSSRSSDQTFAIIIALLFLPLVQLAASIVTLIWIQIRSAVLPDKKASLQRLGKVTLWSILGSVAGLVTMILGFKMFH